MMIMNEAQYLFTRSQHYFERSCKAEDAKQKKAFEAVATELWLDATTVLNRQVRLVEGLDVGSIAEAHRVPPTALHFEPMTRHTRT
jgi:hypothetical protein